MVYNLHRLSKENDHPFAKGKKIIQNIEKIFKRETHNWENRNWAPCQGILAVSWSDPCNPGLQHKELEPWNQHQDHPIEGDLNFGIDLPSKIFQRLFSAAYN